MKLEGRVAVVTGANAGLGRAAALHLVREKKMRVALVDLDFSARGQLEREMGGENVSFHIADVSDADQVASAFAAIGQRWHHFHACVNAAGIAGTMRILKDGELSDDFATFERTIDVNLKGSFHVMARAAAAMAHNPPDPGDGERGVILNVSSVAALEGTIGHVAYAASKAGVLGMILPAARELGRHGIRVIAICPGFFDTAMVHDIKEHALARMTSQIVYPKRLGEVEEFALLAAHLMENSYVNASFVRLDGGVRLN